MADVTYGVTITQDEALDVPLQARLPGDLILIDPTGARTPAGIAAELQSLASDITSGKLAWSGALFGTEMATVTLA